MLRLSSKIRQSQDVDGNSAFDPVLCELMLQWFCPRGGVVVLDPFAGISIAGMVASLLGFEYRGVELSEPQVKANRKQAAKFAAEPRPIWHHGDAREIATLCKGVAADFIFTTPPYPGIERYSDGYHPGGPVAPVRMRQQPSVRDPEEMRYGSSS